MRVRTGMTSLSVCIAAVWMLMMASTVSAAEKRAEVRLIKGVVPLKADDVTVITGSRGELSANVKQEVNRAIYGFETPQDTIRWTVAAPEDGDYVISLLYSMRDQHNIEVSCGDSVLVAPSITCTWENRPFFWRQELPGTLRLKAGENQITVRLPDTQPKVVAADRFGYGITQGLHLWSIEIGTATARKAQVERAQAIRGDASWMVDGKYGIFVHWSALSHGFTGNTPRADWFQDAVKMFDVNVFADAIERTGAAWIVFTSTHKGFFWPAPNAALDKIMPGRTAERDLLGEIITELDRRGIRTLFYMHTAYNGYETTFRPAAGALDDDKTRFSDNIASILRYASLRYGEKLMGFGYIDGSLMNDYPLDVSWEDWARAIKAGNPNAVAGFSSNRGPRVSPFSELTVTDGGKELLQPDPAIIGPGKQLGDVTSAWWCLMDQEGWFSNKPMNGEFGKGPSHSTEEYVAFFKRMATEKVPVTINLIMTADVTDEHPIFNPKCMAVMEEVRKAIRGK
ncbi:Alpha-L-fucosidase [Novipirellula aureliae]|uniref:Alpha-L-fucosidase n=1 Tax=Novipirellula aureliae TaxID=2527966 RepID=A0A5C6E9H1_9BACT|nr:alpha-L-fucosidase [Novipirellula aureliae]TWU44381.1 Alpha-L-fucosidase [Novipirellula aureliae]